MPTLIRSVQKAMRIVDAVASSPSPLTAGEIARRLGIPLPTTHHLLGTLVAEGMLSRDGRDYGLGPLALALADASGRAGAAPPYLRAPLRQLAGATGETAYVTVWRNDAAMVLSTVEGAHAVRVSSLGAGFAGFSHARASGKVLLAFGGEDRLETYLAGSDLAAPTGRAIHSERALRAELERVRAAGISFDREEFSEGAMGLAAPVLHHGIAVAAFAVTAPADRFTAAEARYADAVRAAAEAVSEPLP